MARQANKIQFTNDMPKRIIIAGKRYDKHTSFFYTKGEADMWADHLRKKNRTVRLVKAKSRDKFSDGTEEVNNGYVLYSRAKEKKKPSII